MRHDAIAPTHHRIAEVEGLEIFYREAGSPDAPTLVLLHGFPTSSHMYRNLIPRLADGYHVIAPDLPGFGLSAMPVRGTFDYTFERLAQIVAGLLEVLNVGGYTLYVMDYGAPTGFRLALRHPDRIRALIVQNGNAYEEGLQAFWDPTRALWAGNTPAAREAMRPFMSSDGTRFQYVTGVRDVTRLDPAAWLYDQVFLDRPEAIEIQLDLIYDYRTNVALYPRFHAFFRARQPPTLILWGANDPIFALDGAKAFLRDLPDAELHVLDTGHFVLEDRLDDVVPLLRDFLARHSPDGKAASDAAFKESAAASTPSTKSEPPPRPPPRPCRIDRY